MTDEEIRKKVHLLLKHNINKGYSPFLKQTYSYIMPSDTRYPFQWFWDTCFHIFILCSLEEYDLAKQNIQSLFAMQEDNGFVGHMVFWKRAVPRVILEVIQTVPTIHQLRPTMSALIQPSFVAQAVLAIYEGSKDKKFLEEMVPKIKKYHNYIRAERDFQKDGLITIISPFESGMDWKPSFDHTLGFLNSKANPSLYWKVISVDLRNFLNRYNLKKIYKKNYFLIKEVGLNTIYAKDLEALIKLCQLIQDPDEKMYREYYEVTITSILEKMYDPQTFAFYDLDSKTNEQIKILTPTIFFPLVLPNISKEIEKKVIATHLFNTKEFALTYPLPSVAATDPSFDPNESEFLWRGPTWAVYNWFLYHTLKRKGYRYEAKILKESLKHLIEKSGFREYYNPLNGEGYGAKNFTWAGLVIDMK